MPTSLSRILFEAHRRYPEGARFKQMGEKPKTVTSIGKFNVSSVNRNAIAMSDAEGSYVYQNGRWADRVK